MNQPERWQALQSHLASARALENAGDRVAALAEVEAALALDPQFLAAQALRDRLLTPVEPIVAPVAASPLAVVDSAPPPAIAHQPAADARYGTDAALPVDRPLVSTEGYARFEARAKRRRVDRRVEAARAALARQRLHQAGTAIDEIAELDPNLPELAELRAQLDALRRTSSRSHAGPWLAAAAVFVACVLGASYLQESNALLSHPFSSAVALVAPVEPVAIGTTGTAEEPAPPQIAEIEPLAVPQADPDRIPPPEPPRIANSDVPIPAVAASAPPPPPPPSPAPAPPQQQELPPTIAAVMPPPVPQQARVVTPPAVAAVASPGPAPLPPPVTANEEVMVRQALQRYRHAYEGLDAQSAHAVWPAVNQAALARAFDGLASQSLNFESCDVQLRGDAADATCRGTARYVPKVGSREPRVEPRTWSFKLRKAGADWKIDNARAER